MATSSPSAWQRMFWKVLFPVLSISLFIAAGLLIIKRGAGPPREAEGITDIEVGHILPDFSLSKITGEITPVSTLKSKVILINFWATWCEACMEEMPSIVNLRKAYQDRGFEVLGINVDENPEKVLPKVLSEFKIDFPVYGDPEGKLSSLFDVHAIPFTVILNHQRKILLVQDGGQDWNSKAIRNQLERWLSE